MVTKTHKRDLGLGLPEKNKKKKMVVKDPETRHSVLNSNSSFTEVSPMGGLSPAESVTQGQAPEMPLVKKKKKKNKKGHSPHCEGHPDPGTVVRAQQAEKPPSPRTQALDPSEFLGGEKKKKRKSLCPLATAPGLRVKTSLDPSPGEEVARVGKKLKKHKEKKAQEAAAFSAGDPWFCQAEGDVHTCSLGKGDQEQAALGQKRKPGSPREHRVKMKKKKKTHREAGAHLGRPEPSSPEEGSAGKGKRKKPGRAEASESSPVADGLEAPVRKKRKKSNRKAEQPVTEEPAPKRRRKKRKEGKVAGEPREEEEEPDTDLEVVLERKGNMDEAHIDQVRRKALQEEIDRESGKTEASEARKQTGTQFGQWDTAGFENEEQKLKFLKLMGGFKNLSPSFSRTPDRAGRPNMALSRKAADSLQRSLQQDYDRALSWKCRRGAGLGFATAANKTFYIDRNASKSIKFED